MQKLAESKDKSQNQGSKVSVDEEAVKKKALLEIENSKIS